MQIIDISRELFSTEVFPGDPVPMSGQVMSIKNGDVCNLSLLTLGSHSGTHMDAPKHFIERGADVSEIVLEKGIGKCFVKEVKGKLPTKMLEPLFQMEYKKLLIKGNVDITPETASLIAEAGVECLGVEKMTLGTSETSPIIHRILLEKEVLILENLNLDVVQEGEYNLVALPLKIKDLDGSPCRAVLIRE